MLQKLIDFVVTAVIGIALYFGLMTIGYFLQ